MKKPFFATIVFCFFSFFGQAEEGMWLYSMLDRLHLEQKGCKLSPEQIYSINNSSLKDAIFGLGSIDRPTSFFCTAELVGSRGLLFTNHHCGYDYIAQHSTVLHNYLHDGFWAARDADELPNEGFTAARLVRMLDVTDSIMPHLADNIQGSKRLAIVDSLSKILKKRATDSTHYEAEVESMFANNQYFLFVYEVFKDIRLVGTPPESIGKFGGDTDNWMWPRHTGDFSIFRIYVDKNGKTAEYDSTNIPFKTDQHLKISLKGYKKDDYAMIMGYPGSTERYNPSIAIQHKLNILNPLRITIRTKKLERYKQFMDADTAIYLKYASKYAQASNYWKNFIGENQSIKNLKVIEQKNQLENELQTWINADSSRKNRYGDLIQTMDSLHNSRLKLACFSTGVIEAFFTSSHVFDFGYDLSSLENALWSNNDTSINEEIDEVKASVTDVFSHFDAQLEEIILADMLQLFFEQNTSELQDLRQLIKNKYKGNYQLFARQIFKKSFLCSQKKFEAFLKNPSAKKLHNDEGYSLMYEVLKELRKSRKTNQKLQDSIAWQEHLYVEALLKKNEQATLYPDANSTPRLTFGHVEPYCPRDAVYYNYYTTIQGLIEKENPANQQEFSVPQRLKDLYRDKDFGNYATNDSLKVCFLTSNDITGGNSGSPVLNQSGELIGIAFDGNWESLSGDIIFASATQRTINVDIRYVLFIIDKFAGCTRLLDEMTLKQ